MVDKTTRNRIFGTPETNFLNHSKGFASWAFTLDHKRIGIMYLIGVTISLFLAGFFRACPAIALVFFRRSIAAVLRKIKQRNLQPDVHAARCGDGV